MQQVLLHAGQLELGRVAALAGGAPAEQPGLVADHDHGQVGGRGRGHGRGEPGPVAGADGAAAGVAHVGQFLAQGVQHGDDLHPGLARVVRVAVRATEMSGHAVAAEERQRVIGQRADDRDPGGPGDRQRAGRVGQQDHGFLGQAAGQGATRGRVQVRAGGSARHRSPAGVEQAQLALLPEHPGHGPVHQLRGDLAGLGGGEQGRAVAPNAGQLHVHARGQGQGRGPGGRRGDRVL